VEVIYVRGKPWLRENYEQHLRDRRTVTQFVEACRQSDAKALALAIVGLENARSEWRSAMRRVRRLPGAAPEFRRRFLNFWISEGDSIRQEVGEDVTLAGALRILLPPYRGLKPITLYRGEGARNWRYRCPSISWTATLAVAEDYARRHFKGTGGSVVLKATVPAKAIISKVPEMAPADRPI
jgi:hypothetical protein